MTTNTQRSQWAANALNTFIAETKTDHEDALSDLLNGMMHLADQMPSLGSFQEELGRAQRNYESEKLKAFAAKHAPEAPTN